MKQRVTGLRVVVLSALLGAGCGGGSSEAEGDGSEPEVTQTGGGTSGGEQHVERDPEPVHTSGGGGSEPVGEPVTEEDGMQLEGILGTMAPATISRAMAQRMDRFTACFASRYDALPVLGGAAQLSFRVRQDSSVHWVHLTESNVGDRETERCVLGVAASMRFSPGPVGGEAEFQDTLDLQAPEDVRPPVAWQPSRLRATLRQHGAGLRTCTVPGDNLRITVYVDPGATVAAVGASFVPTDPEADSQAALDCVTRQVAGWGFPDPGSYTAKVTFEAP